MNSLQKFKNFVKISLPNRDKGESENLVLKFRTSFFPISCSEGSFYRVIDPVESIKVVKNCVYALERAQT
jgi:hypothetical protein